MRSRFFIVCWVALLACAAGATAQKYPERGDIRKGNRDYERARYEQSEDNYRSAVEKNPDSFEARYNLGNALYRQGEWEGAEALFSRLTQAADPGSQEQLNAHYNSGNAMFQQRKLEEALEAYKEALRIDPSDLDAKFNLAYVKKLLEKDDDQNDDDNEGEGGDGGGEGNDDQDNQDDPDDNNGGDDGDDPTGDQKDDESDENGEGENDGKPDKPDDRDGKPQDGQRPPGMTREEAESLLEAMQMSEDKTREKMEERKAAVAQPAGGKNW